MCDKLLQKLLKKEVQYRSNTLTQKIFVTKNIHMPYITDVLEYVWFGNHIVRCISPGNANKNAFILIFQFSRNTSHITQCVCGGGGGVYFDMFSCDGRPVDPAGPSQGNGRGLMQCRA